MKSAPKHFVEDQASAKTGATKDQYRMLADGTILDQFNDNKTVGYVIGRYVDEVWRMHRFEKQSWIKKYLNNNQ